MISEAASETSVPQLASGAGTPTPIANRTLRHLGPADITAPVYQRAALGAGDRLTGPALIIEPLATTLLMPGQVANIGVLGEIVITEAT